jgi:hypothetical protein
LQKRKPRSRPELEFSEDEVSLLSDSEDIEETSTSSIQPEINSQPAAIPNIDAGKPEKMKESSAKSPIEDDVSADNTEEDTYSYLEQAVYEEVMVFDHKIKLTIPGNIIEQSKLSDDDAKSKLAGYWAAQIIKENPQLTNSPLIDPVAIWHEIKDIILEKMNSILTSNSTTAPL